MHKQKVIDTDTIARAKRTRSARKFAGLTMEQLNIQHNIPPSTLQGWENIGSTSLRNRSLTLRGAQRLVLALEKEGVACTIDWLMDGTGLGPQLVTKKDSKSAKRKQTGLWEQHLSLQNEIRAFEENNSNAIAVMMTDYALEPFYAKGDVVAGVKHYLNDIDQFLQRYCIIETKDKEVVIRQLVPGQQRNRYSLVAINPKALLLQPALKEVRLNWVAPILWHRKPF